jgi:aspartate/tyrosine/aromatic aminotransferase
MSFLSSLSLLPSDPILGLTESFKQDPRKEKVNLGVGAYKTEEGRPFVLPSVRCAEEQVMAQQLNKEYLPLAGNAQFIALLSDLILGKKPENFFGMQTVAGTGALRLAIELLQSAGIGPLHLSKPTWPNHNAICQKVGIAQGEYHYYSKGGIDFSGMCEDIAAMPEGSAILLQASCHNPTGCDLSLEQWKEISALCKKRNLFPLFDIAYQGFGEGIEEDVAAVRYFVQEGHELLFTASCSKIFGLYGERVGMVGYIAPTKEQAAIVASHLKVIARGSYSTPSLHGARIVATILEDKERKLAWEQDLTAMRNRIQAMRTVLLEALAEKGLEKAFSPMASQKGMFSYSGLLPEQVALLAADYGIYMPKSGRINIAGLNKSNVSVVANAIEEVIQKNHAPS